MAKFDANGRPIYETAEEYNKAHGTGSARRHTYDSPEGENYKHTTYKETRSYERAVNRQSKTAAPRNKKKLVLAIVIGMLFVNIGVVFAMFLTVRSTVGGFYEDFDVSFDENYDEDWTDDEEGYGEYVGDSDTALPEDFASFTYNGTSYSLPMSYDEFTQMGFTLEEAYDEDFIIEAEDYEHVILNGEDGYMIGMIRVYNDTQESLPMSECIVNYFNIENDAAYDEEAEVIDFVFGDSLTMESTYEDVEAYLGTPYYQYIDDDEEYGCYESYEWRYNNDEEYDCIMITFWDGIIADVSIEKYEY